MDEFLNQIIKSDELAREKIKQASDYRTQQIAKLPEKKKEIEKKEIDRAVNDAVKRKKASLGVADQKLEKLKSKNIQAEKRMNELLASNGEEWVKKIVEGVING